MVTVEEEKRMSEATAIVMESANKAMDALVRSNTPYTTHRQSTGRCKLHSS